MANFTKYKNLLPTLILAAYAMYTAIVLLTSEEKTGNITTTLAVLPQHYGAFAAVTLCLVSFFFARRIYRYVLGLTLALGIFSILNFTVYTHIMGFKLGALNIGFQPLSLAVAILTVALNWKRVKKYFAGVARGNKKAEVASFNEEVDMFKVKYFTLSAEELQKIIDDKRFRPEAIEAARILLYERERVQPEPSKN